MHRILFFCFFLWLLTPLHAAAQEALFSAETQVDTLGEDPILARKIGLALGQRQALGSLLEKFAPDLRSDLMKTLDDATIATLLHSQEVVSEAVDGNRYRATLRLNFFAGKLNSMIEERLKALQSDEVLRQPSSLMFPIFWTGDKPLLFEPQNKWRKAWIDSGISHRSGTLILPYGDASDIATITAENVIQQPYNNFLPALRRYGVRDAVILMAELRNNTSGQRELHVVMRRVQATKEDLTRFTFPADADIDDVTLMQHACADLATRIQASQAATQAALSKKDQRGGIQLLILRVASLRDHVTLRKKIAALPQVDRVELMAFSPQQADIRVYYRNAPEQLQDALKAMKIRLTVLPEYWTIEEGI